MLYFLLIFSTLVSTGKSVVFKKIGTDSKSSHQLFRQNVFSFLIASIIALTLSGFNIRGLLGISPFSALMSILFALTITVTYLFQIKALALGNSSSTMLIYSCGFLLPIFFSAAAYNEEPSVADILAIALLLIALFLIINPERNIKFSLKWLIYSLISMSGSGCTAILQKIHQRSAFAHEFISLTILEFIIAAILLTLLMFFTPKPKEDPAISGKELSVGALNGIFLGSLNLLNLSLAGKLPAIILFPVYNIGSIILTGILCSILYKEKNTKKGIIGFAVGCIAILIIGIF